MSCSAAKFLGFSFFFAITGPVFGFFMIPGRIRPLTGIPSDLRHYKLRYGDCPMDDIRKISNANLTTCSDACDAMDECQAFLYVPSLPFVIRNFKPYCWLKHKTCKLLAFRGTRNYRYYDKFRTLGNYTKRMRGCEAPTVTSIPDVTLDICKDACDDVPECKAFVYHNEAANKAVEDGGTRCDLKTDYCTSVTRTFNHSFVYTKVSPPVTRNIPNIDCVVNELGIPGAHYMGKKNVINGVYCMRWDLQIPGRRAPLAKEGRGFFKGRLPDSSVSDAANYCRMPWKDRRGPYCYTGSGGRWPVKTFCNIPKCDFDNTTSDVYSSYTDDINVDCLSGSLGADYIGTTNVTKSGKPCKPWSLVKNVTGKDFPEGSVEAAGVYCRNPFLHRDGPWCYLNEEGTEWERCDIKMCPHLVNETECKHTTLGEDYMGRRTVSASGKRCVHWHQVAEVKGKADYPRWGSPTCRNPDLSPDGLWCFTGGNQSGYLVYGAKREKCDIDYCEGFIPQWLLFRSEEDDGPDVAAGKQTSSSFSIQPMWFIIPIACLVLIASVAILIAYLNKTNRLRNPFTNQMKHSRFQNAAEVDYDVKMSGLDEQPF